MATLSSEDCTREFVLWKNEPWTPDAKRPSKRSAPEENEAAPWTENERQPSSEAQQQEPKRDRLESDSSEDRSTSLTDSSPEDKSRILDTLLMIDDEGTRPDDLSDHFSQQLLITDNDSSSATDFRDHSAKEEPSTSQDVERRPLDALPRTSDESLRRQSSLEDKFPHQRVKSVISSERRSSSLDYRFPRLNGSAADSPLPREDYAFPRADGDKFCYRKDESSDSLRVAEQPPHQQPGRSLLGGLASKDSLTSSSEGQRHLAEDQNSAPECDLSSPFRDLVGEGGAEGGKETHAKHRSGEPGRVFGVDSSHLPLDDSPSIDFSQYGACGGESSALLRELGALMESRDEKAKEAATLASRLELRDKEMKHAREALAALKSDRKRLKCEKFDLLTQMKQLYSTLEDKEAELRQFIRNYEQKVREGEERIKQVCAERSELEQEKWALLKRARDESERSVLLTTQLGFKDGRIRELQHEIAQLRAGVCSSPGSSYRAGGANGIDSPGSDPSTSSPSYANTPHAPADLSPVLSRSAEELFARRVSPTKKAHSTWNSISRVFSRSKKRKALDPATLFHGSHQHQQHQRCSWSPQDYSGVYSEVSKLRLLEETHSLPMGQWRAATLLAWLEITMDMPQYARHAQHNVKSGKILLELSDSELEEGLGISNPMHRRKLRLAIEEHRQPALCRYPKLSLLSHTWVLEEWLPSLSLPPGMEAGFRDQLVDGRVLDTLTRKDLERHLGISRKFHQLSVLTAIQLLRMTGFDRQVLEDRRARCETLDVDPLVWSNGRLGRWAAGVELGEWAGNLRGTGVHGALAVLEPSFTAETMATALGIPPSKNILRRHLTTEWNNLIQPARLSLESECRGVGGSCASLASQGGRSGFGQYARRTLDRRRASWRESLRSLTSLKRSPDRPQVLPLSPPRHRRTHSETLTVTPV